MFNLFAKKRPQKVIMHCSATPDSMSEYDPSGLVYLKGELIRNWFKLSIMEVRIWHLKRGFSDVGYHYFIKRDGTIERGRPVGKKGAHCYGHNDEIGVCYAGTATPTERQMVAMVNLSYEILNDYGISPFNWRCHNEYSDKTCPGFSYDDLQDILIGAPAQV